MAQLGQTTYYKDTTGQADVVPYVPMAYGGNTPSGYTPVTRDEYLSGMDSYFQGLKPGTYEQGKSFQTYNNVKAGTGMYAPNYVDPTQMDYYKKIAGSVDPRVTASDKAYAQSVVSTGAIPDYHPGFTPAQQTEHQLYQANAQTQAVQNNVTNMGQGGQTYTVKQGDTLTSISKMLGVPISSISGYRSGNPDLIFPGETLTTSGNNSFNPSTSVANSSLASGEIHQNAPPINTSSNLANVNSTASGLVTNTPTQEAYQAKIQELQKGEADLQGKMSSLIGNKPATLSPEDMQAKAFQSLGLPADFTKQQFDKLTQNTSEIQGLQESLNNLDKEEQLAKSNIEGQSIPMGLISNQQMQVERQYAIKKTSIAADMSAKAAYGQSLKGNYDMVSQLVDKAVTLATHEQDQKIADYKWMYDNYQSQFNDLSSKELTEYNTLLQSMQKEQELTQQNLKDKMNLYLQYNVPVPDMSTLKNQTYQDAAAYVSRNRQSGASSPSSMSGGGTTSQGQNIPQALSPYAKTSYNGYGYVDLSGVTGNKRDQYAQAAAQAGLSVVTNAQEAGKINAIGDANANLQHIADSLKGISLSGFAPMFRGVANTVGGWLGDANIRSYNAWRTAVINNVQALAGGQGSGLRINQAEIDMALKNDLPVISGFNADTPDTAQAKIGKLQTQLNTWEKQLLGGGNRAGGSSGGTTQMTGPGGTFNVPNDKVDLFKQNGYK